MLTQWKSTRLTLLFSCCMLAACTGLLESSKAARQVFLLQPPSGSPSVASEPATSVLIMSVKAVPGLDTDRILVLGTNAQLNPVANAHWSDHIPEVFTSLTRRYLSSSNQFGTVREGSIARAEEWLLELELQAFYGTQGSSGDTNGVILQLEGSLRCNGARHVLRVSEQTSASGDSLSGLVEAHQRVLNAAMPELSSDIVKACADS